MTVLALCPIGGAPSAAPDPQAILLALASNDGYRTLLLAGEGGTLRLEGTFQEIVGPVAEELCPLVIRPVGARHVYVAAALACSTREPPMPVVPSEEDCSGHDRMAVTFIGPEHLSISMSSESQCWGRTNVHLAAMVLPVDRLRDRWVFDWSAAGPHVPADSVFAGPDLAVFRRTQLEKCRTLGPEDRQYLEDGSCAALPAANPEGYSPAWFVARGPGRWEVWDAIHGWRYNEWPYRVPVVLPPSVAGPEQLPVSWEAIERAVPSALDAVASADGQTLVIVSVDALQAASVSGGRIFPGGRLATMHAGERVVMFRWAQGQQATRWRTAFRQLLARRSL